MSLLQPAPFSKRQIQLADGCFRDIGQMLMADDGSYYFLEWTPPIGVGEGLRREKLLSMAAECTLAGGGWDNCTVHEAITLVDYAHELPATHPELRAETPNDWMATKTEDASSSGNAVYVGFYGGHVHWGGRGNKGFARFVRRVAARQ